MAPRPFPFALRVGTDIVSITRIREALTRHRRPQNKSPWHPLLDRLFTQREQDIFHRKFPHFTIADDKQLPRIFQHIAGRWAAKEAVVKAAKPRRITLLDVEILMQAESKEMYALIRDKTFVHKTFKHLDLASAGNADIDTAADEESDENDPPGQMAAISISHDRDYATAVCIAPFGSLPGDVGGESAARMYDAEQPDDVSREQ